MIWLHLVSYFFGGMFLANVVPHFVSGMLAGLSKLRSQSLPAKGFPHRR